MNILKFIFKNFAVFILTTFLVQVYAQQRPAHMPDREKIEVAKTTFLSRQMRLTPEEARLFWPVYDQYQEAIMELREDRHETLQNLEEGLDNMSDSQINATIDAHMLHAEKTLAARKRMITSFREFLPPRKIAIFLRAEKKFNQELQQRLKR